MKRKIDVVGLLWTPQAKNAKRKKNREWSRHDFQELSAYSTSFLHLCHNRNLQPLAVAGKCISAPTTTTAKPISTSRWWLPSQDTIVTQLQSWLTKWQTAEWGVARILVLSGATGTGKTTLLHRVVEPAITSLRPAFPQGPLLGNVKLELKQLWQTIDATGRGKSQQKTLFWFQNEDLSVPGVLETLLRMCQKTPHHPHVAFVFEVDDAHAYKTDHLKFPARLLVSTASQEQQRKNHRHQSMVSLYTLLKHHPSVEWVRCVGSSVNKPMYEWMEQHNVVLDRYWKDMLIAHCQGDLRQLELSVFVCSTERGYEWRTTFQRLHQNDRVTHNFTALSCLFSSNLLLPDLAWDLEHRMEITTWKLANFGRRYFSWDPLETETVVNYHKNDAHVLRQSYKLQHPHSFSIAMTDTTQNIMQEQFQEDSFSSTTLSNESISQSESKKLETLEAFSSFLDTTSSLLDPPTKDFESHLLWEHEYAWSILQGHVSLLPGQCLHAEQPSYRDMLQWLHSFDRFAFPPTNTSE